MHDLLARALCVSSLALLSSPGLAQCEIVKLLASDGNAQDRFGYGLQIKGNRMLIPAKHDEALAADAGSAYIFDFDGANWVETAKLTAAQGEAGDLMGWETQMEGDLIMLGAVFGAGASPDSGTVVTFSYDGLSWNEGQTLMATNGADGDLFGRTLALSGDLALVGAPHTDASGSKSGSVYVFERIGGVWTEVQTLVASDAAANDQFGWALDYDGGFAAIGAFGDDDGATDAGAVYIFERVAGSFTEVAKVTVLGTPSERFGWTVRIDGDHLAAGAPFDDQMGVKAGAAYLFERSGGVWSEIQKLVPADIDPDDRFGTALELEGGRMLVSSFLADMPESRSGVVYIYEYGGGSWTRTARLAASDGLANDQLGRYMSLDGDRALLSSITNDENGSAAGAAYLFDLDLGLTPYCFCSAAPVCGNDDAFAGCETSVGVGALLTGCGSSSITADDLVLQVHNLPPNQFGLIYMGAGAIQVPFGDGQRCVGAGGVGTFRYPIRNSGGAGTISEGPGLAAFSASQFGAAGQLSAGASWKFQYWFRDPAGTCGAAFNLSNALAVLFGV